VYPAETVIEANRKDARKTTGMGLITRVRSMVARMRPAIEGGLMLFAGDTELCMRPVLAITKRNQCERSSCSGGLLSGQCSLEGLLRVSDEMLIAHRVDKDAGTILRIMLKFREHIEVPAVCAEKYIAG
jgi:hypothetical protein